MATGFKTGGRTKGTPNKKTTDVQQLLENLNCNPIEGMARIAENIEIDISIRLNAYKEIAQYMFPKRRAVDLNASIDVMSHEDFLSYLDE